MENIFKDIIDQLFIINNFFKIKALTKKDFKEEQENYNDLARVAIDFNLLLDTMSRSSTKNISEGCKNLMRLHTLISGVYWHVDNVHQRIIDVIKKYPTLSNDSYDIAKCNFPEKNIQKEPRQKENLRENVFKKVIDQLVAIDKSLETKTFSKTVLRQELENYDEFVLVIQELRALILTMQCTPVADLRQGSKNLVKLRTLMDKMLRYVQNVHNRVRDVIREYPIPNDI